MPERTGEAVWEGDLSGQGTVSLGSGAFRGPYSAKSRFEDAEGVTGTNPEELIGAAHAACYSMALAHGLSQAGHVPTRVHTTANVRLERLDAGFAITRIDLVTEAEVPGLDAETFQVEAESAKANCPVSKALAGTEITLDATLA
ncbi:MAG TPA: OsmC family protein [Acidimicrobiales bacterium]|nr:OsmC family protein [Acidimicrobiales bacterium]